MVLSGIAVFRCALYERTAKHKNNMKYRSAEGQNTDRVSCVGDTLHILY
jgi:hypothetical protein